MSATNKPGKPRKRDITRARVIEAAIERIYEDGFYAAHTNRIVDAAGVSWGVLQYHFGDKDGLLQAVLDHIFADFSATLAGTTLQGKTLHARIDQLIEVVWSLVSRREYRVSMAILRNAGKDSESAIDGQKQVAEWSAHTSRLWHDLFADSIEGIQDSARNDTARRLLFATLRGMADEVNPGSRSRKTLRQELAALGEIITYLLTASK